jgi:endo-1,4-beta-D-glucanase Y
MLVALVLALWNACGDGGIPGVDVDGGGPDAAAVDAAAGDAAPRDAAPRDAGPSDGAPADGGTDLGHPFGTHSGYHSTGVIFPSGATAQQRDQATADYYDAWKAAYLEPACQTGHYRVHSAPATAAYTVSEAHGYAMLIVAIMAGHDPDARALFDGLHAYFLDHPSSVSPDLMAWAQDDACQDVMGADSATDGDLDIAYALLLASVQWGNGGAVDYQAEAVRVIGAILTSDIHPQNTILLGDWAHAVGGAYYTATRTSDFLVSHFKAFRAATSVPRWDAVVDKTYSIVAHLQNQHAATTGLLPDFVEDAPGTAPRPADPGFLEGVHDGHYGWNACRTPWRLATDFLLSGEPRARDAVRRLNAFFRAETGDDPTGLVDGYQLDGTPFGSYPAPAFLAPAAVAAMVEPASGTNQAWLDALWGELAAGGIEEYYGDTLRLLAMIVLSNNWWTP